MQGIFSHDIPVCLDFTKYPDVHRIQQGLKHFFNANALQWAQPLAPVAEFGVRINYAPITNIPLLHVVHIPTDQTALVFTTENLAELNVTDWIVLQIDRWLAEYTPDMVSAFEAHAEQASERNRAWYRVNSVTAENKLVLQRQLFETDYWETVFTMQTTVHQVSAARDFGSEPPALAQEALLYRTKFFCADHAAVRVHEPLVRLVTCLFLDEGFYFWGGDVEDHDDHSVLTLSGSQYTTGMVADDHYYGVKLKLFVEKFGPHEVLSMLSRIRDVVGDPLQMKDSSQVQPEQRFGAVHNRSGLNE